MGAARVVLTAVAGLLLFAQGAVLRAPHAVLHGPSALDVLGIVAMFGGIVLLASAVRDALRGPRRRTKLLAIPLALAALQWIALPLLSAALVRNTAADDGATAASLGIGGARDV